MLSTGDNKKPAGKAELFALEEYASRVLLFSSPGSRQLAGISWIDFQYFTYAPVHLMAKFG